MHFARLFVPLQARKDKSMQVVYEDNHIIIVNKESGEIVQGDKTGDRPLSEIVKDYIKEKYQNAEKDNIKKTYWAIVEREKGIVKSERGELTHWLVRNEQQNKSYAYDHEVPRSKKAQLRYRVLTQGDNYDLVEVELLTGRHHQIRCQLSAIGRPIKGDLKYGARRSNPDGSISLQSHRIEFVHPVSKETICIEAPIPNDSLWEKLAEGAKLTS